MISSFSHFKLYQRKLYSGLASTEIPSFGKQLYYESSQVKLCLNANANRVLPDLLASFHNMYIKLCSWHIHTAALKGPDLLQLLRLWLQSAYVLGHLYPDPRYFLLKKCYKLLECNSFTHSFTKKYWLFQMLKFEIFNEALTNDVSLGPEFQHWPKT